LCTRHVFATPTREGRSQSYIKLASGSGNRPDALFIGGIHAREWVPPDALLSFARNLLVAFTNSTDVVFPAGSVKPLGAIRWVTAAGGSRRPMSTGSRRRWMYTCSRW